MLRYTGFSGRLVVIASALLSAAVSVVAQQQPVAPQAPPRSPYQEAGQLPARIMAFTAEPSAIKPGESTMLRWAVENPRSTTIEPAVGRAAPRGELRVTPTATTTYTLTAVIEDPNVFAGPWLITRTFPFLPEFTRVDEFFCENNRDYKPLFGAK